jgi:hypothetical protein
LLDKILSRGEERAATNSVRLTLVGWFVKLDDFRLSQNPGDTQNPGDKRGERKEVTKEKR